MSDQTYQSDPNLDAALTALKLAKSLALPLIDSPSQNEAKRQDVVTALQPTRRLLDVIGKLKSLNWLNEADGVTATLASINQLMKVTPEQKTVSWRQINDQLDVSINNLTADRSTIQVRSEKESKKLVADVDVEIKTFQPAETFTDADWRKADGIYVLIQDNTQKAATYPLAPQTPWNATSEIKGRLQTLDAQVEVKSGTLANKVESVTRRLGMRPQAGRKAGMWTQKNHWYLLGLIIILFVIFKKRK